MKKLLNICFATLLLAVAAQARDTNGDVFETILIPIAFSASQIVQGAYGAQWTGEIWVENASSTPVDSLQPTGLCFPPCPPGLPAGFVGRLSSVDSNNNDGGALFYVPAVIASKMHFSSRLLELTRRAQPTGVEMPVIREDQFFSNPTAYLGVPVGSGIRSALRVYDPRLQRGSAVQVDFLSPSGEQVASTILRPGDDPVVPLKLPVVNTHPYPGAAAIRNITDMFPQLQAYAHFHIRLTPLTPGMQYWAMVSVTDNETQHVLLITAR